jgi:hypothetical protein
LRFKRADPLLQFLDLLPFRIGHQPVIEHAFVRHRIPHHPPRNPDHRRVIRYRAHHNGACPDPRVIPNPNSSQNFCACADNYVIPQGGMPFAPFVSGPPQSHILVQQNVVPNLGRLTDHDAHPVIYKKSTANPRARVNFDSGEEAGELRDYARHQRDVGLVESMGEAV